jgi:hypothetical protein
MKGVYGCPNCKSTEGFTEHNIVHADYPFTRFNVPEERDSGGYADSDTYGLAKVYWESAEVIPDDPERYKCDVCEHTFYAPELIES